MIAQLRGRLLRKQPQEVVVDVAGVGYRVTIPLSTFYRLGEPGSEVTLLTHTHVREDALALFGFLTAGRAGPLRAADRRLGRRPQARRSRSSPASRPPTSSPRSRRATSRASPASPGVGKKTAERLVARAEGQDAGPRGDGGGRRQPAAPRARRRTSSPPSCTSATRGRRRSAASARALDAGRGPLRGLLRFAPRRPCARRCCPRPAIELAHRERPPRHRPPDRRRPRLRGVAAPAPPRRVRRPAAGHREPARRDRGRARPRRGARPRAALRPAGRRQDQPRARDRGRARGPDQGHGRAGHRARGRPGRAARRPSTTREILFVDEIHRLDAKVEEILYPALEDYSLDLMIGSGPGARSMKIPLKPFTLVGATTRAGLLTAPLRGRFGIVHRLDFYSDGDLAADHRALGAHPGRAHRRRRRGRDRRAQPRHAARRQPAAAPRARLRPGPRGRRRSPPRWRRTRSPCSRSTTTASTRSTAGCCSRSSTSSAAARSGVNALAAAISEEPDAIEDIYEPYLLQHGFLDRTPRGRIATAPRLRAPRPARPPTQPGSAAEEALLTRVTREPGRDRP